MLIEVLPLQLEHAINAINIKTVTIFNVVHHIINELLHICLLLYVNSGVLVNNFSFKFLEALNMLPDDLIGKHE
jgi:hypothetical protein